MTRIKLSHSSDLWGVISKRQTCQHYRLLPLPPACQRCRVGGRKKTKTSDFAKIQSRYICKLTVSRWTVALRILKNTVLTYIMAIHLSNAEWPLSWKQTETTCFPQGWTETGKAHIPPLNVLLTFHLKHFVLPWPESSAVNLLEREHQMTNTLGSCWAFICHICPRDKAFPAARWDHLTRLPRLWPVDELHIILKASEHHKRQTNLF